MDKVHEIIDTRAIDYRFERGRNIGLERFCQVTLKLHDETNADMVE